MCWCSPLLILPGGSNPLVEGAAIFVLAGMAAGGSQAFATHSAVAVAFNIGALLPTAAVLALRGGSTEIAMSALVLIYFGFNLGVAGRARRNILSALLNEHEAKTKQAALEAQSARLDSEIAARTASERAAESSLERTRALNSALEVLFAAAVADNRSTQELIRQTTEECTRALDLGRVGLWLVSDDRKTLNQMSTYVAAHGKHYSNLSISMADYPRYFEALVSKRYIDAVDGVSDPRTKEFEETIRAWRVKSMLHAPIIADGRIRGVLACDTTEVERVWSAEETAFVAAAAQLVSMSVLADDADQLNQELKEALSAARHASATKSAFLATMSHEIRTPMNGILGAAELLNDDDLPSAKKRLAAVIQDSGETLLTLLNDILDLSKIEAGRIELEERTFSIADVAEKVSAVHVLKAREKSVAFSVEIDPDLEVRRSGDPHRIAQVLHNLVSNAIKFTHEGAVAVTIGAGAEKDALSIEVRDTGIGMSPKQLSKVFEPFRQADSSTTREFGGTGLGLSIANGIVTAMGGRLEAESEKGAGSLFRITLPAPLAQDVPPAAAAEDETGTAELSPMRVLVAEDNPTNRLIIDAFLKRLGASVAFAENGREAVEAVRGERFDGVFMDIQMPELDGEAAFKAIRAYESEEGAPSTPIFAVTANAMAHQVEEYAALGFDGHVAKPVNAATLAEALRAMETLAAERTPPRAQPGGALARA